MLLRTKGIAHNIQKAVVGRVTRDLNNLEKSTILICENLIPSNISGFAGLLTSGNVTDSEIDFPVVSKVPSFEHLFEGDIIFINKEGYVKTLYRVNSMHNILFVTERCNSNCLMCSQPPKDKDDIDELYTINLQLISLIPKDCIELCITGGEPTLMGELFFKTIEHLKEQLPDTEIHILTNGRSFAWSGMAEKLGELAHTRLMLGIPLYADYYQVHDYIVQANNAFYQTIMGIHNLARHNQRIEIRVVLHKESVPRLTRLAKYIYKNLPFVEHIAFMGLEHIGYTPFNMDKLWIDPYDYMEELEEAVEFLSGHGMFVSIYNSQLCVLPMSLWKYARKSISDWKNSYLPECSSCVKLQDCGGMFIWNLDRCSRKIKPIKLDSSVPT